ncbi:MAG: hypothetical protein M1370_01305 [Bacteroidetes bacterium]|nr:hypothetical protein [Bacteroidota bacterium]MCL5027368.1 hypothetical protein [Chloroflexota bacterium]
MPPAASSVLFLFVGLRWTSPVEAVLSGAYQAVALDTIARAKEAGTFDRIVVATNSSELAELAESLSVDADLDEGAFHFGQRLRDLVRRYQPKRVFYLGAGSAPLLSPAELASAARLLECSEGIAVSNNFFSADIVGFAPGEAIEAIEPPLNDNDLPYRLVRQAGLRYAALPRSAGTMLDIDTPTDLAVLKLHPGTGPHARSYLATLALEGVPLATTLPVLRDPSRQVVVAGRVGQAVWTRLESDFRCGVRVYAEERGMRASGREGRGEVRSLLGFLLEEVGPQEFFRRLADLGQAAFLDSRVLFHHCHWRPSAADRFYSDLLDPDAVGDERVRDFTRAAREAPIPVVLGGHSLVSGGLWTLADISSGKAAGESATSARDGQMIAAPN